MNDFIARSDRRSVAVLTAFALGLAVYGSLYPFRFSLPRHALLVWSVPGGLSVFRDVGINLMLYVPGGFLLYYVLASRGLAVAAIAALSVLIEFLQAFDAGRVSSSLDVATNVCGGAFGAAAASLLRWPVPRAAKLERHPAAALLIALAVSTHLFPFIPRVHLDQLRRSMVHFLEAPFDPVAMGGAAGEWIVIGLLLRIVVERQDMLLVLAGLVLVVPAGVLVLYQWPVLSHVFGAAVAIVCLRVLQQYI